MSPQYPRRPIHGITQAAVWLGSTSVALFAGCVDAPGPATSPAASDAVSVAPTPHEPGLVDPTPVQEPSPTLVEPTPLAADAPDPDGWSSAPTPLSAPPSAPTVASAEPTLAEPTLAEPTPVVASASPSLIPGGLSTNGPTPEPSASEPSPTSAEPTLADPLVELGAPPPTVVADTGKPVANPHPKSLEPKPLEAVRPKSLILISPRNPKPLTDTPVASTPTPPASSQPPAVILPPSAAADAGLLSPLKVKPEAPVTDSSLASLDPKVMTPALPLPPEIKPHPLVSATGTPVSPISISQPIAAPPTGFTSLFNHQDLSGWEVYDGKPDSWQFKDGEVSCVAPGGGWLQTRDQYSDFELRFEYRLSPGGNSGVCLRFPGHGNPSLEGLEIQLLDDRAEKYQSIQPQQATGSLYFVTAPKVRDAARLAGEWNQCTLRCVGDQLQVTINNQLVNEIDLGSLTSKSNGTQTVGTSKRPALVRSPLGSVALQSHSTRVDFRSVHIQDLTQALASGVRWLDLKAGTGDPVPAGAKVTVHYLGYLSTGKRFANSFEKAKPATVPLQEVIPGWREGIPGMKVGGQRRLIVPANMAYGAKGFKEVVPPNSTLVYEIELIGFEKPAENAPATAGSGTSEVK